LFLVLEESKIEGRTTIFESLIANNMPTMDKDAGTLRKDLDANELSAASKSEREGGGKSGGEGGGESGVKDIGGGKHNDSSGKGSCGG
jgi:hypothetical protein